MLTLLVGAIVSSLVGAMHPDAGGCSIQELRPVSVQGSFRWSVQCIRLAVVGAMP